MSCPSRIRGDDSDEEVEVEVGVEVEKEVEKEVEGWRLCVGTVRALPL